MDLGFVTAILPDHSLEEVFKIASDIGYDCIEVMCWPLGKAERRYAGITHIDLDTLTKKKAKEIREMSMEYNVRISALGYYPNPLTADLKASKLYVRHIKKLIRSAPLLGLDRINTFVGKDHTLSVDQNWPRFVKVWKDIISIAEKENIKVGIENCPMFFTNDEWPGGQNLATSPDIWRRMYKAIPSKYFGLNFDPSHFIIQHMDYELAIKNFKNKLFHVHAKDCTIDKARLDQVGILAPPNEWHIPKLPGLGDVNWGKFFSALSSSGFDGAVCVEVEDRAYEGSAKKRIAALQQCYNYLRQYIPQQN